MGHRDKKNRDWLGKVKEKKRIFYYRQETHLLEK